MTIKVASVSGLLFVVALVSAIIAIDLYGLYLAFSASVVFGVVAFMLHPVCTFLGLVGLFGRPDLAEKIVDVVQKLLN